ncbi:hypothetical protein BDP81DRAFT_3690 [Colletotrichum phormii]|uniref:Uncharacterized protein n=1 Tax=Colletotrichum phormii TaxID=359342 RepID=A0AAJ0EJK9_9PEZI|nr:uncharacterized protein BDP81DRAFT_3690 [Colletotrichum phormii]KAK1655410.1 hypothetical protein BDP81DRAFT_3690 [Colletotrichum phormii]
MIFERPQPAICQRYASHMCTQEARRMPSPGQIKPDVQPTQPLSREVPTWPAQGRFPTRLPRPSNRHRRTAAAGAGLPRRDIPEKRRMALLLASLQRNGTRQMKTQRIASSRTAPTCARLSGTMASRGTAAGSAARASGSWTAVSWRLR